MSNYLQQSPPYIQLGCILKIDKVPKATSVPTTIAKFNICSLKTVAWNSLQVLSIGMQSTSICSISSKFKIWRIHRNYPDPLHIAFNTSRSRQTPFCVISKGFLSSGQTNYNLFLSMKIPPEQPLLLIGHKLDQNHSQRAHKK